MGRIIIVSNRLPVKTQQKDGELVYKPSEGGLATGLGSVYRKRNNLWIGWPGTYIESYQQEKEVKQALAEASMFPVFLTRKEIKEYYEGFSNETLWPTFHYFPQYAVYEQKFWEAYVNVNQKFCDEVARIVKAGDTVWINDYQLLLLPSMLREKFPKLSIGFFLHIPFPSYEIFRLLPWREELLRGMLGADLLGFHTFDYARHFLSALNRGLGVDNIAGQIFYQGRTIVADAFPMSIDYELYESSAASPKTIAQENKFRSTTGNRKLILAIDRLDYTKGIPERFAAFEKFLVKYPEYREQVSFIQVLVPSRDKVEMYRQLKEEINRRVGSINSSFGSITWTPVYCFYRSFPPEQLSAFYRMADIAFITPLRDGMNLVAKEYIASKLDKKGVLVLSELTGAAMELSDALLVNPNDVNQVVNALYTALNMPVEEQQKRMEAMQSLIRKFNIHHWVKLFLERLEDLRNRQQLVLANALDETNEKKLKEDYINAKKRFIFLDYDGTLVPFKDKPEQARPDRELLRIIRQLSQDSSNRVVIVSGRDYLTLEKWFGGLNLEFIAEHGVWLKLKNEEWQETENLHDDWKDQIFPILEQFVNRTPGAFIEEKSFSLVWHFRKVERGLGAHRSRELINHLRYMITGLNVQVLEGDMVVEVKSIEVNKGRAVSRWLQQAEKHFILVAGDDHTDEDMFRIMPQTAYTIKVRSNISAARFSLSSYQEVRKLLKKMVRWSSGSQSTLLKRRA